MLGDGGLDQVGVDRACIGIDVYEDGQGVEIGDCVDGRDERVRGRDDLVARADAQHAQRGAQGRRAAVGQDAVGHAHRLREHLFETVDRVAAQAAPVAASHRLEQGFLLTLVDDGPDLREGLAADRCAAADGQHIRLVHDACIERLGPGGPKAV